MTISWFRLATSDLQLVSLKTPLLETKLGHFNNLIIQMKINILIVKEVVGNIIGKGYGSVGHQSCLNGRFVLGQINSSVGQLGVHFGVSEFASGVLSCPTTGVAVSGSWLLST